MRKYDKVAFITNRLCDQGAPIGATGYIIEEHPDGAFEVEISDPSTGNTLALVVAKSSDLQPIDDPTL